MPEFPTNMHRIPVEREEVHIRVEFSQDSPELMRILGEARSQEGLTGYPKIQHDGRSWLLISETYHFTRSDQPLVALELLQLDSV